MKILVVLKEMWYILCGILKLFGLQMKRLLIKKFPKLFPYSPHSKPPKFWTFNFKVWSTKNWVTRTEIDIAKQIYVSGTKRNFEIITEAITEWLKRQSKKFELCVTFTFSVTKENRHFWANFCPLCLFVWMALSMKTEVCCHLLPIYTNNV
jgi:hypothetical protein